MLTLQMYRAVAADLQPSKFRDLLKELSGYDPVITSGLATQADILGVPADSLSSRPSDFTPYNFSARRLPLAAEVLSNRTELIIVRLVAGETAIEAGELQPKPPVLEVYRIACDVPSETSSAVIEVGRRFGLELEQFYYKSKGFRQLVADGSEPPAAPTAEEKAGVAALCDFPTRTLALAVKSSGGLLVSDLAKQLSKVPGADPSLARKQLEEAGLVELEVVVVCRKTSAQTARVPSRDVLDELVARGLRCSCGRPANEEKVEEALTITSLGRHLLDGSRWMSILLVEELTKLGVPLDRILIEQTDGGDELDCLADIGGELVFFELKDKEFSLGNAYSFGAKIGITRPQHPVVITTDRVAADARDHFHRARTAGRNDDHRLMYGTEPEEPAQVRYIEGLESLRSELAGLITEINQSDSGRLLRDAFAFVTPDPAAVLSAVLSRPQTSV